MLKVIIIPAVVVLTLLAFSQPAMSRDFADIYTECGLGAMIAPRNEAVAAVTNVTWDLGTTAISSNITSPDTCEGGKARMAAFIHDSYESLAKDLAGGSGTYLDALIALNGEAQTDITALRADFAKLVADPSYTDQTRFQKAEALYNLLNQES